MKKKMDEKKAPVKVKDKPIGDDFPVYGSNVFASLNRSSNASNVSIQTREVGIH